jgi:hypothetical protein
MKTNIRFCAGILEQSMGTRNRVGIGLSYQPAISNMYKVAYSRKCVYFRNVAGDPEGLSVKQNLKMRNFRLGQK